VTDVELQVVRAAEVVARLTDVDADHVSDVGVFREALHDERAPPTGYARNENPPLLGHPSPSCRIVRTIRGPRARWAGLVRTIRRNRPSVRAFDDVAFHEHNGARDGIAQRGFRLAQPQLALADLRV